MGHHREEDRGRSKSFRRGGSKLSLLVNSILLLKFTVTVSCLFVQGSAETVEGFGDFIELPVSPHFNLPNVASNYRALSEDLSEKTATTEQPSLNIIDFQKPKISLSLIQLSHGAVESSKTILEPTNTNVTKVIDEGDAFADYNEIDESLDDIYRVRPAVRGGITTEAYIGQKVLRLECTANFPVEFGYEGFGAPYNITTKSFRNVKNFTDRSTYTYSTVLDFFSSAERHTGLYVCGPVRNASLNGTQMLRGAPATSFRLYVRGNELFFSRKNTSIALEKGAVSFLVPCPISDPGKYSQVKLYNVEEDEMVPALFDMNKGFHVFIKHGDEGLMNAAATYVCKDDDGKSSPHYKVFAPKDLYTRITPNVNYIPIVYGQTQIFKCESKRHNVTLTFSGDRQPRPPRKVNTEINEGSEYPYLAMYEINPMEMSAEHTVINCVSVEDGMILHTWEYSTYADVSISRFYFDGSKRYQDARYMCCSNSFYKPKLEYVLCRSETECEMKKLILDEEGDTKESILEPYAVRFAYFNNTCVSFQPHFKYTLQTGVLRCSVQGITKKVQRDFLYYFNPYRVYQAFTDDRFDHMKVLASESIMKMSKTPSRNTLVGQKTRFLCYFSEFFISNGVVWSLEMKNGSMSYFDQPENLQFGNTSFSQIELQFDNTDVSVIRCHAPVRTSPYEWRNLSGPIFVRDIPKIRPLWVSENGTIEKILSQNATENGNLILEEPLIPKQPTGFVVFECSASYPVDWVYSGEGLPEMDFQAHRHTEQLLTDFRTYNYSAKLKFFKIDKQVIGKYSCISANREFAHRGKDEDLKVDFYVFVPDAKIFTNRNNGTVRVWEYRDSVNIPCTVTDPRVKVTLHKFNNDTNSWKHLDPEGTLLEYAPLSGFTLTRNATSLFYGMYRCEAVCNSTGKTHYSGYYSIILPFDPATRLTPFQKQVKILSNETQLFKCEAKEEVTLQFSDHNNRTIVHDSDPTSQFPFSASYTTQLDEFSNFTVINCTTKKLEGENNDMRRVLHTWEFYPDDPNFIDSFTFDNTTGQLSCCTKPYREAVFEWMNCSSITECYNRQSACLRQNKCQSSYTFAPGEIDVSRKHQGCIAMNITEKPQGFVRCVVTGIHKIVTQAYMYYYNVAENYEIHDGYFLAPKVFEKFTVPNDKIMKIQTDKLEKNITVGENVKFNCSASKFFSGAEIRWAFERKNGTVDYFFGNDLSNYNAVESEMTMKFDDSDWQRVYCFAPNWSEYYGWRNVSLPLNFHTS